MHAWVKQSNIEPPEDSRYAKHLDILPAHQWLQLQCPTWSVQWVHPILPNEQQQGAAPLGHTCMLIVHVEVRTCLDCPRKEQAAALG